LSAVCFSSRSGAEPLPANVFLHLIDARYGIPSISKASGYAVSHHTSFYSAKQIPAFRGWGGFKLVIPINIGIRIQEANVVDNKQ